MPDTPDTDPKWDAARRQIGDGMLSVIMPAYNLGHAISDNLRHVHKIFSAHIPIEIIPVDDGSSDNTSQEIEKIASSIPSVHPVILSQNTGKGAALRAGFAASKGTHILLLDGDLDLPPRQVSGFFDIMEIESADIVIGSKRHPESVIDYPWHRKVASTIYYGMVKLLIGLPIHDTQTGIKLFTRESLAWAMPRMLVKRFAFDLELLSIAHGKGYRVAEAPITLEFHTTLGSLRPTTVRQIMTDTLAIFYRVKVLRYYESIRETKMPSPPPLISIVVAFPASTPYLDECIDAIQKQTYTNYEVILLPDEDTGKAWPDAIREIATGRVRPAEKRNRGIKEAKGSIIAFLDDDAFPTANWLDQALVYFSDESVAAIGGPATTPAADSYMAKLSGRVYANPFVSGKYRCRYTPTRVMEIDDYPSCNLFVRKQILDQIGGFRTDFWPGEDTYLCLDIVRTGKTIMYDPRAQVYHHRRALFMPHLRQIARYALHRGCFARRFPETSRKISYMMPTLFVAGVVFGGVAVAVAPILAPVFCACLAFYAVCTILSCYHRNPAFWILTWIGIVATHVTYGVRFLMGLLTKQLPCEVQDFDHVSENQPQDEHR